MWRAEGIGRAERKGWRGESRGMGVCKERVGGREGGSEGGRENEEGRLRQEEVMRIYAGAGPRINTRSIPSQYPAQYPAYLLGISPIPGLSIEAPLILLKLLHENPGYWRNTQ